MGFSKRYQMSNYMKIRVIDISNGPGCRVSIFLSGCPFHCFNCFNQEAWDPKAGKPLTEKVIDHLLDLCAPDYIQGLSILGGEPLWEMNQEATLTIAQKFKEKYPKKTIWLWTGHLIEDVYNLPCMQYIDVVVDGQFVNELRNPNLKFRGSSNQRIIDIKQYLTINKK